LFGVIGTSGVVRNLSVKGSLYDTGGYGGFGLLAGVNYGTIAQSHASGSASSREYASCRC
jgi:hypothetical protein